VYKYSVLRNENHPYYITILNLKDIEFPMTLDQIKKFEYLINYLHQCLLRKKKLDLSDTVFFYVARIRQKIGI